MNAEVKVDSYSQRAAEWGRGGGGGRQGVHLINHTPQTLHITTLKHPDNSTSRLQNYLQTTLNPFIPTLYMKIYSSDVNIPFFRINI